MSPRRGGFTFLEVIACLMVAVFGLMGVVALVLWGNRLAADAQGHSTAMLTALTVAADPQPLLPAAAPSSWTYTPYGMDGSGTLTSSATGYLNGFYVVRSETSADGDVIARDPASNLVYARSANVQVDVFDTFMGTVQASYSTRLVRQRPGP